MGCDIHFYVEKKDESGKWASADKWSTGPWECGETEDIGVKYDDRFYAARNYDLFAILANVRNGRGFAGCITGTGFNPISDPRGLPEDVSPEVKAQSDMYGSDGHSHSWLTLAELLAYNWNQTTKHIGVVGLVEFARFERDGRPQSYSGDVFGEKVSKVSHEEMRAQLEQWKPELAALFEEPTSPLQEVDFYSKLWDRDIHYYTTVAWEESYADCCKAFIENTMLRLQRLALGQPESVRIVFFFDN